MDIPCKVYLASPYTHNDKAVMEERFINACKAAGRLLCAGFKVFSPIAHSHPIAQVHDLPVDYAFWSKYNLSWISWADRLYVLRLDGWKESTGVQKEIEYALLLDKPIVYME
jgi:nucleoside 2-deoxyribosyltransferase